MDIVTKIALVMMTLVCIKSFTIGCSFSFHLWLKHGKKYTTWYNKWIEQRFDPDSPDL